MANLMETALPSAIKLLSYCLAVFVVAFATMVLVYELVT